MPIAGGELCDHCHQHPPLLGECRALFEFAYPLPQLLHRYKYGPDWRLARPLAGLLLQHWPRPPFARPAEWLIPLPLHASRLLQRGFNQTALLARPLAKEWGLTLADRHLQRVRATATQVGQNRQQRLSNLQGAFRASPAVAGRHIVLLDDVMTTGASLHCAAEALLAAGAVQVDALALARVPD